MGKKGKKAQAGKPKKLTLKDVGKRLDVLVKKLGEELEFRPVRSAAADRGLRNLFGTAVSYGGKFSL